VQSMDGKRVACDVVLPMAAVLETAYCGGLHAATGVTRAA
jgi:hypothetical protein